MKSRALISLLAITTGVFALAGCHTATNGTGARTEATAESPSTTTAFDRPGFEVEVVEGRLWVLKPGQEKSGKNVTLIGAGPQGMTVRALDHDTALEYLASKPGFEVEVTDGRLWVLKPGQEKSAKHVTRIAAGPRGMTVKALDTETIESYLADRP